VRYIGSKSRLLGFIRNVVEEKAPGAKIACDIFAGTAAVAGLFKKMGYTVISNDIMEYSYAFQVAAVEACQYPRFEGLYRDEIVSEARADIELRVAWNPLGAALPEEAAPLAGVVNYLNRGHANRGFFWNNFSVEKVKPSPYMPPEKEQPEEERMFFTSENAERIDGIRAVLHEWRKQDRVTKVEFYVLLAALVNAADAAANTTGVYGAFLKEFGSRQDRPLELQVPRISVQSPAKPHHCRRGNAVDCAREEKFDLLYLDPPYNRRDYAANYHVPELIARGWFDWEPTLEGKTGMVREFTELRSDFCLKSKCINALEDLVSAAAKHSGVRYILMSYSSEGLIPDEEVERVFNSAGRPGTYEKFTQDYKRYRSDSDSPGRAYKSDSVQELLYFVEVDN
jgi:adenine-specific DNA-methyltransferase